MRASLILLAVVLASLRLVQAALAGRLRRAPIVPSTRGGRSVAGGRWAFDRMKGKAAADGAAEAGENGEQQDVASPGDAASARFAEWRYYGFSHHGAEADAATAESIVADSPAVGSVVSILPADSVNAVVNGRIYWKSGSVWYQRQYTGSNVTYVVVRAP